MVARGPEDLLALLPIMMGFTPERSLCVMAFGPRQFHARVDLPPTCADLADIIDLVLRPARDNQVACVFIAFYDADRQLARDAGRALIEAFLDADINVIDVALVAGGRWWLPLEDSEHHPGRPHEPSNHPLAAEAVVAGVVTLPSRAALAQTIASDAEAVAAVQQKLVGLTPLSGGQVAAEREWVRRRVGRRICEGTRCCDAEAARVLRACRDAVTWEALWLDSTSDLAVAAAQFWGDLLRRAPDVDVPAMASLAALNAWLSGHGALAWCALERSPVGDRASWHLGWLTQVLSEAVPPTLWEELWPLNAAPLSP